MDGTLATYGYSHIASAVVDPNGHLTVAVRNGRGQVMRIEEWGGACARSALYPYAPWSMISTASYYYDVKGNLVSVFDANGNPTTMNYDALNRKIAMVSPDMHGVNYTYDAVGQLTKQTDAKYVPFAFTYDSIGRPLTKGRTDTTAENVSYVYDTGTNGKGRLNKATYLGGSASFTYDATGAEVASAKVIDGITYNVTRKYDALGRLKEVSYPDGVSKGVYTYNTTGQLKGVSLVTGGITKVVISNQQYNAQGQVTRIDYGNGVVALYTYDTMSFRLKTQRVTDKTGKLLQGNDYTYDPKGNIIRVDDKVKLTAKVYTYDERDRLKSSKDGAEAVIAYAYDKLGNLIKKGSLTYTYGQNGAGVHAVTSITDGSLMTYDANGNMLTLSTPVKTQYFTYDGSNRLVKVEQKLAGATAKTTVAQYAYDGDGGRTTKTVYSPTTKVTRYVGDLHDESSGVKTDYVFTGGARVAAYDGSKLRWFIGDHLGSTSTVLDESGVVKEKTEYTPWGEVKKYDNFGNTSEVAWFYFTGKRLDDESGLIYFGARYYAPKLGRFITADTIVQDPYNPQTLNRYSYCNNNPINLVDPTGHSWLKKHWKTAVTIAVGIVVGVMTAGIGSAYFATTLGMGSFWGGVASAAVSGAIAGGAAGGTGAALYGGNISQGITRGAAFGALSGAVYGGMIGKFGGTDWNWKVGLGRVGLSAAAGGGISELAGGSFKEGAMFAGAIAGADFAYRSIVSTQTAGKNIGASMRTAENGALPKLDSDGNPLMVDKKPTVIHIRKQSNVGFGSKAGERSIGSETGFFMDKLGRFVPGMQGMSLPHDITVDFTARLLNSGTLNFYTFNFPTMPVLYGLNAAGSLINDSPGMIGYYEGSRDDR